MKYAAKAKLMILLWIIAIYLFYYYFEIRDILSVYFNINVWGILK